MEVIGKRIKLRPFAKSDIDDYIRWNTIEIEWMEWDAPWEENDFNIEEYREFSLLKLEKNRPISIYSSREIEIIDTGEHIGRINSYNIDENYEYTKESKNLTIGIDIYNPKNRKQGYATEAWSLHIDWLLENGKEDIYTQTWSENYPALGLFRKLGFELTHTDKAYQKFKGKYVDGLTFKLNAEKFKVAFQKWKNDSSE